MHAVAVAQFAPGNDRASNVAAIAALTSTAVERGASLVVFPEYSSYFTAEMGADWIAAAEPLDGPFVAAISALASRLQITIVVGLLEAAGAKAHNTVVAIGPSGEHLATYRKQHLYDAFGAAESDWIAAGPTDAFETFAWNGFTVGMQTCYDIRFPEVSRALVDRGANLLVVPAEWVRGPLKEHHWRTLLTARAIENTVYVAAADHAPPVGAGNSMVLDPMGVELVTIGENSDVALAFPSQERLAEVRRINPAVALRRYRVSAK